MDLAAAAVVGQQRSEIALLAAAFASAQSEYNTLKQRCEHYAQAYDSLQQQLKELLRNRFGKKSERYIEDPSNPQLSLFSDLEDTFASADAAGNAIQETPVAVHTCKKKQKAAQELPHRIEIIPVSQDDMQCSCGACKTVIRYETKESIHYEPPVFEILEQRREVAACPNQCDGAMVTAPAPCLPRGFYVTQ